MDLSNLIGKAVEQPQAEAAALQLSKVVYAALYNA